MYINIFIIIIIYYIMFDYMLKNLILLLQNIKPNFCNLQSVLIFYEHILKLMIVLRTLKE